MGSLIVCLAWTTPINTAIIILARSTGLTKLALLLTIMVGGRGGGWAKRGLLEWDYSSHTKPWLLWCTADGEIEPKSNLVCKFRLSITAATQSPRRLISVGCHLFGGTEECRPDKERTPSLNFSNKLNSEARPPLDPGWRVQSSERRLGSDQTPGWPGFNSVIKH